MKKKQVIYMVALICLVTIVSICIYKAVSPNKQKTNESNSENINESGMMHGDTQSDTEKEDDDSEPLQSGNKSDSDDVNGPQKEQEKEQCQGGQTDWKEEGQEEQKQEQESEQEQDKDEQDKVPEKEENKKPQPNTESGWGPIT